MEGKKILLALVRIIHKLIVFFVVMGVFLPPQYLILYIPVWPIIYLHWQFNSNRCVLTELEYWLESKPFPPSIESDHDFPYIRSISGNLFINLTNIQLHKLIISSITIVWLIGVYRYYNYTKAKKYT